MTTADNEFVHPEDQCAYCGQGERFHEGPIPPVTHTPHRGSDVETWLKAKRDTFMQLEDPEWFALDDLLDDYRLRADVGAWLDTPSENLGPHQED